PPPKTAPSLSVAPPRSAKKESLLSGLRNAILGRRSDSTENSGIPAFRPENGRPSGREYHEDLTASNEVRAQMEQLLGIFTGEITRDKNMLSFSAERQVTVRYELSDINLSFYMTFDNGAVRCSVGEPPEKPQVTLKMKAEILDRLFTGRENGPKAAMSGKL